MEAIGKSVVLVFSVETISEAIAEFMLEDWSNNADNVWLEALGSWLHRVGFVFPFAVEGVSLLGIGGSEKRMR